MRSIILLCFISGLFYGCLNQCPPQKSLGQLNCEKNYIPVSESRYIHEGGLYFYGTYEPLKINDLQTYKNSFPIAPDSMPFGYIDFNSHTLLALSIYNYNGTSASSQGGLCYNPANSEWMFKMEYTTTGDCESDGRPFLSAIICPKLPVGAVIEFKIRNINY